MVLVVDWDPAQYALLVGPGRAMLKLRMSRIVVAGQCAMTEPHDSGTQSANEG